VEGNGISSGRQSMIKYLPTIRGYSSTKGVAVIHCWAHKRFKSGVAGDKPSRLRSETGNSAVPHGQ
jgi:hypothetical protein